MFGYLTLRAYDSVTDQSTGGNLASWSICGRVICACSHKMQVQIIAHEPTECSTNMVVWPKTVCCHSIIKFQCILLEFKGVLCVNKKITVKCFEGNVARSNEIR